MKILNIKKIIRYALVTVSLFSGMCFALQQSNNLAIFGYDGSTHRAFKAAESIIWHKMTNQQSLSTVTCYLGTSFLNSVCCKDGISISPQVYALTCGDICADEVWLSKDEKKREEMKDIASRITYIESISAQKECMHAHESELSKFVKQCELLSKQQNYCCTFISNVCKDEKQYLTVFVAEKKDGLITVSVLGECDRDIVKLIHTMITDKKSLKKIILNSLNQYYSAPLVKKYVAWLGLNHSDYNIAAKQPLRFTQAREFISRHARSVLEYVYILQERYALA